MYLIQQNQARTFIIMTQYTRIAKLFQNEEPKTRGRSIFKLTEKQKLNFTKQRLRDKMKRQIASKNDLENKINLLQGKIEKTDTLCKRVTEAASLANTGEERKDPFIRIDIPMSSKLT